MRRDPIYFQSSGEQQVCFRMTCRERKDTQEDGEGTHLLKHEVRACTCERVFRIRNNLTKTGLIQANENAFFVFVLKTEEG